MEKESVVHGTCPHDCYDTCSLRVYSDGARITRIAADPDHAITRGFLCMKVNRYMERLHHPDRVLYPLRRKGPKGSGEFQRIAWDEALGEIAERMGAIINAYGGEAVLPYSFAGNMGCLSSGALDARFFHAIGASRLDRTICTASGNAALRWVFGSAFGPDPETIARARFILLWGANSMATNIHGVPLMDEARKKGAAVWTVDPLKTDTAERYDRHLKLRPGTDLALALGLGRHLLDTGRYDRNLMLEHSDGFDTYRKLVQPWTLARTAEATGIPMAEIEELAERLAAVRPLLLRVGYGVQRQRRSAAAVWAISVLSLLTGSWRDVGGGLLLSNGDAFPLQSLAGDSPATRTVNMVQLGHALLDLSDPPVKALVVYNSNPAATAPDQARVLKGLARDDLFTVVHEQMLTDTAKLADFVLPAAMSMEVWDVHTSYWHRYVQLNQPAAPPAGEAVSNPEFFRRMARALGLSDERLQHDDLALIRQTLDTDHPWMDGITLETLLEDPVQKLRIPTESRPFLDTPVTTPHGKFRLQPPPGTAVDVWDDAGDLPEREFQLLTPSTRETIKSSFGNVASLRRGHPAPELLMADDDMRRLGIEHGQKVRVRNELGSVVLQAVRSEVPQPGTVVSYAVRWNHEAGGKNINQLTSQDLADFGGGATFYSARVFVESAAS
ncbi:MAG: molybdopterin-dependent oxidoreductase [Thermaerobacter sp.]|nr:molybdopterin-dependent oxidoreductase [Thermaerobacter sp.]